MTTLHLMVGLPCSGKTALARRLEYEHAALRLTRDEWHARLFGQDVGQDAHHARHDAIEALLWGVAARVLQLGTDVILDFGCWERSQRDDFRSRAADVGVGFRLHYLATPPEVLISRLAARNAELPEGVFHIPEATLLGLLFVLEPPSGSELEYTQVY